MQMHDTQTAAVLVTHDATHTLALAGRLLVLVDGRVARSHRTDVVLEQWDHRHNRGGCRRASG
jgi:ABC-type sulfate/molybdate transport systems ATPase subunit